MQTEEFSNQGHKRGYILVEKSGPSESEQRALLEAAGVEDMENHVYVDRVSTLRFRGDQAPNLPMLDAAIMSLRPGNILVVASASRVSPNPRLGLDVLKRIGDREATVLNATTMVELRWHPDVTEVMAFIAEGATERQRQVTGEARAKATKLGFKGGRKAVLAGALLATAKALWSDTTITAEDVPKLLQEKHGKTVSVRTLYAKLGRRSDAENG